MHDLNSLLTLSSHILERMRSDFAHFLSVSSIWEALNFLISTDMDPQYFDEHGERKNIAACDVGDPDTYI